MILVQLPFDRELGGLGEVLANERAPIVDGAVRLDGVPYSPRWAPADMVTLRTLRANGCNALRYVVIQLPHAAPLHTLSLDGCRQLESVLVAAAGLESLVVSNCGQLQALGLRCG